MKEAKNNVTRIKDNIDLQKLNNELENRLAEEKQGSLDSDTSGQYRHGGKRSTRSKETKRKKKGIFSILLIVFGILVFLAVAVVGGFLILQWQGKASLNSHEVIEDVEITAPEDVVIEDEGMIITYNGKRYRRNEDIVSILCMGVDTQVLESDDRLTGENGQADSLFVVALDTVTSNIKMINISRDSMVDVDIYNVNDEYVETSRMQLCLAYAYGNGKETSCKNMIKSVSRLLYGMPIDAYAAIDLPAINVLNDAIGGVEVEVIEDLSDVDPELIQGARVLLQGGQAETYVRNRDYKGPNAGAESNNARMARQRQYLTAFISKALAATKEDITVPVTLYQAATEYMATDIGASEVTYLASHVLKAGFDGQDIINVPGEAKLGEVHAEYYVDEAALYEIILDVYYVEI